ncbi:MAG TPA: FtsW/RodA/SpoVE family cell cycle protein [Planctomycetota bacterium]|nr:FtsW/RodA/SpoVE family cell cycle protein [Planctomycetota bacterium]HRR82315.1 FtsW/RodA/SpoVE family cell cycle protein [Planctomycetota bacterium]
MIRRLHVQARDWVFLGCIAALLAIGLAFVYSASYRSGPMGEGYYTSSPAKQVQWIAFGALAFVALLFVNYRHLLEHAYVLYLVGLASLVFVLFFGVTSEEISARRWIALGPLRVQPSEFMKLFTILALARYLMDTESHRHLGGLLVPFALVLAPMLLIVKEPDLGMSLVFLPIALAILYAAAARPRHLLLIVAALALAVPLAWPHLRPYQKERILGFLTQDESRSRQELHRLDLYQLEQAKVAIGSGQLFGRGWMQGSQNRLNFIPAKTRNNDFIFAVICEEWGFVGANLVLGLFLLLLALCGRMAEDVHHPGGRLIVVGVVAMLGTQAVINTAMASGQMPIVGLTLPLVSYGGSSIVASLLALGLVFNVSAYRRVSLASDTLDPEAEARRELAPIPEESFMRT